MASVKKTKQPGENISLKTKKTEDPLVMDWINAQTNLMDSLRYLIEHEIVRNGVRNLQAFIPVERNVLGTAPSVQERVEALPPQEPVAQPEAVLHGIREIREGTEQSAAAQSVAPKRPEPVPEPSARFAPEPSRQADDEIDDEDIEAWV